MVMLETVDDDNPLTTDKQWNILLFLGGIIFWTSILLTGDYSSVQLYSHVLDIDLI